MRYLSLFSGIEAASAAWASLGWECAAVAEIEPFPCAVLAYHHPTIPNLGDVTKVTEAQIKALGHIDLVVFGSPCQDLSVAGQRRGLINEHGDITRSGLFFTAINIFHWSDARFALWENVPGAFSSGKGRDFASVVSFMAGLDDVDVPPNGWGAEGAALGDHGLLEWGTLDAQWFGVAQRRRRVFALLDTGDWAGRPPILLEPESLRGDSAPRRETGESITRGVEASTYECGGSGRYSSSSSSPLMQSGADLGPGCEALMVQPFAVANTLTQRMHKGINSTVDEGQTPVVTHSLRGEGFDASEDGTGRGTPLVPVVYGFTAEQTPKFSADQALTLTKQSPSGGGQPQCVAYSIITANTGANGLGVTQELSATLDQAQPHAVAYAFQPRIARNGRGDMGEVVNALNAQSGETGKGDAAPCVAFAQNQRDEVRTMSVAGALAGEPGMKQQTYLAFQSSQSGVRTGHAHATLDGNNGSRRHNGVVQATQVRRLTPTECERLQGFPDGHTAIPYRGKPACDGPRYKALGNSMAVPVMRHIGIKIMEAVWHI